MAKFMAYENFTMTLGQIYITCHNLELKQVSMAR